MNRTIIIAGGTGFLGRYLRKYYETLGDRCVILTRNPTDPGMTYWDGKSEGSWTEFLEGADVLINLAGKNVNCRYTRRNRAEIIDSRRDSVHVLGTVLQKLKNPPPLWIQAGSLAIYGDTGEAICDETSVIGLSTGRDIRWERFPIQVCQIWEREFAEWRVPNVRKVLLRIGFVLAKDEGALGFLARLTRCFMGGTVLPGTQYVSWTHVDDFIRLVNWTIGNPEADGVYNATAPTPIRYTDFIRALRRALKRPWSPPIPGVILSLGGFLLRSEPALAQAGRRCISSRLREAGFQFRHTNINQTLELLYQK